MRGRHWKQPHTRLPGWGVPTNARRRAIVALPLLILCGCPVRAPREALEAQVTEPTAPAEIIPTQTEQSSSATPETAEGPRTADRPGYGGQGKRQVVDPVEANGPIFQGWPRPAVALLLSGAQLGYLEPCGCAGLENQKGGLKRRHTLIKHLLAEGWPVVPLDLGDQVRRFGPQAEIKFRFSTQSLVQLGYRAVGFGGADIRLPLDQIVYVITNLPEGNNPFVSANVGLGNDLAQAFCVIEAGGRRIGVTSVLGAKAQHQLANVEIEVETPEAALARIVPQLAKQADFLVLLAQTESAEAKELARKFPQFDVVVAPGNADEPPRDLQKVEGTATRFVEVGRKGMYVGVLALYDDPDVPIRYQRVPLDSRFADSQEMQTMMEQYQDELKTLGLDGLSLIGSAHPSGHTFVGSEVCAECHTKAAEQWHTTPHSHATETLVHLDPPRQYDPECLSCHATGWEPQEYFPFESGFAGLDTTPHLAGNGCENCHGPGSEHVAVEQGELEVDQQRQEELRAQMRLVLEPGEAEGKLSSGKIGKVTAGCYQCHDADNSPDFDFKKYWPQIEHRGKN